MVLELLSLALSGGVRIDSAEVIHVDQFQQGNSEEGKQRDENRFRSNKIFNNFRTTVKVKVKVTHSLVSFSGNRTWACAGNQSRMAKKIRHSSLSFEMVKFQGCLHIACDEDRGRVKNLKIYVEIRRAWQQTAMLQLCRRLSCSLGFSVLLQYAARYMPSIPHTLLPSQR